MLMSYQQFCLLIFFSIFLGLFISITFFWNLEKRIWAATLKEYEIDCPFDFEWKFTKADLILASRNSVNGYLQGKCFYPFSIPGLQCYLRIYPNENSKENQGQILIYLNVNASKERKIAAEFKFSIESANYLSGSLTEVFEKRDGCGASICKTTKFFDRKNKYFIDEEITIKVKGVLKAQRPSVSKILSPISLKWKIKEDDLKEAMKPESKGRLISKEFNIPSFYGVQYWIVIDTKVLNDKNQAQTFLIFYVEIGNEKKVEAVVEFFVDSVSYGSAFGEFHENDNGYGMCLCLTEDLFDPSKRYIVDGYLTIDLTGILMVERNRRMTMKCNNGLVSRLAQQNPKDFLILVGDKQIPVHKQLLMDVSPVWAGMFGSGMKESTENEMVIKDFPSKIVAAAVKLFYNQNGFCSLTMEEMFMLHKFAEKYFIEFLLDLVERALIKMISPSNVCQFIHLSAPNSFNVPKLHESCFKFLAKCFNKKIPVYGAGCLAEKFLASLFLRGFQYVSDSVTHL